MSEPTDQPDPAAVFACALSLWNACQQSASVDANLNLSDSYQGIDNLMRVVMSIGTRFEAWACEYIAFDELVEVWPYLLKDKFGDVCLRVLLPSSLGQLDGDDCLRIALLLRLPVRVRDDLPVPVDIVADNPVAGSPFHAFRILTVRDRLEEDDTEPFTCEDEPFDEEWGIPYFALFGVGADGLREHIADRRTYAETADLARKLSPGILLPGSPISGLELGA